MITPKKKKNTGSALAAAIQSKLISIGSLQYLPRILKHAKRQLGLRSESSRNRWNPENKDNS